MKSTNSEIDKVDIAMDELSDVIEMGKLVYLLTGKEPNMYNSDDDIRHYVIDYLSKIENTKWLKLESKMAIKIIFDIKKIREDNMFKIIDSMTIKQLSKSAVLLGVELPEKESRESIKSIFNSEISKGVKLLTLMKILDAGFL